MQSQPGHSRRITHCVIHCAATRPSQDIGVSEIRDWHVRGNGWRDVGYHWIIRRNGLIERGRHEGQAGAHVAGHNASSIGICLVGGLDQAGKPAPDYAAGQLAALRGLITRLEHLYPGAQVLGHRDFPGVAKACPSFDVAHWLATGAIRP